MYVDAHALFSDAQAVTAAAASTNLIDLGAAQSRIGVGEELFIVVQVDVAMTDAGSDSTLAVTLEQDDAAAFGSATSIQTIGTFAEVSAVGTRLVARIAPDVVTERYIRLYYTPANGNLTTGSFTAYVAKDIQADRAYADGFVIS